MDPGGHVPSSRPRRRRARTAALTLAALSATAATAAAQAPADTTGPPVTPPAQERVLTGTMLRAFGDGVVFVRIGGRSTAIRMLGVGDPGRDSGDRGPCLREQAAAFTASRLAGGRRVRVVTAVDAPRDAKGRLLGWVYRGTADGEASVNRALVAAGWAPVSRTGGTLRYADALAAAEARARRGRLGRWGTACNLATVAGVQRRLVELGYLPRGAVSGALDYRTQQAVMAFQGWSGLPRAGTVDARTRTRLGAAKRPVPWNRAKGGRRLEVHIDRQVLLLTQNGVTVRAIHVSTGAGGATPRGRFSVIRRERHSWSRPFSVTLPYAQYFYGGYAFHEYPSVPGYPASHGCVRLPSPEAPVVWDFATYGTPVTIA
jgi:endonuclease YncB( thermonuclease family)/lipoprotein-anchoring transpeptidase ErfK/SrfK